MAKRLQSFERAFVSLPKRNRWRRFERSLALPLRRLAFVAILVAIIPLAYASSPDPSWIAGIYDADDYDDVQLLAEMSGTRDALARESLTVVTEIVERISPMVQMGVYRTASGRSPPAAGPVVPDTPISRSPACYYAAVPYSDSPSAFHLRISRPTRSGEDGTAETIIPPLRNSARRISINRADDGLTYVE